MKGSIRKTANAWRDRAAATIRGRLDRLPPRARKWLVMGMLAAFLLVDCYYIVAGFGGRGEAGIAIEHIRPVPLALPSLPPDSLTFKPMPYE